MSEKVEENKPRYRVAFIKDEDVIWFSFECCMLEKLSEFLQIELSSRVSIPQDWTLSKIERYMFCKREITEFPPKEFFEDQE